MGDKRWYQVGDAIGGETKGEEGSVSFHVNLVALVDSFQTLESDILLITQS